MRPTRPMWRWTAGAACFIAVLFFTTPSRALADGLGDPLGEVGGAVSGAVDGATDAVDEVTDVVDDATGGIGDAVDEVTDPIDEVTDVVDDTVDDVTEVVDDAVDDVTDVVDDGTDDVTDPIGDVTDPIDEVADGTPDPDQGALPVAPPSRDGALPGEPPPDTVARPPIEQPAPPPNRTGEPSHRVVPEIVVPAPTLVRDLPRSAGPAMRASALVASDDPCEDDGDLVCLGLLFGIGEFAQVLGTLAMTGIGILVLLNVAVGLLLIGSSALAAARGRSRPAVQGAG